MSDFRPIARGTFADVQRPTNLGPASQLQWIEIEKLVVDDSYQRPIDSQTSRTNVRAIAARFDWRRFAPVIVSPVAGGLYAIVDGQHRTTAALLVGIPQVPCCVILADQAEQAKAFAAINGQVTAIKPSQIFKAKLASDDPEAKRIEAVCTAAGVRIMYSNKSAAQMRPGETIALSAIRKAIEVHGDKTVRIALDLIRRNAGDGSGYLRATTISAVVEVLADHHEWRDHPQLHQALEPIDIDGVYRQSLQKASGQKGVRAQDILQAALITLLDQRLKKAA